MGIFYPTKQGRAAREPKLPRAFLGTPQGENGCDCGPPPTSSSFGKWQFPNVCGLHHVNIYRSSTKLHWIGMNEVTSAFRVQSGKRAGDLIGLNVLLSKS